MASPGEGVQDDVDTLASGEFRNLVGEGERARIAHMVGAEVAEKGALFLAAGGRNHLGAAMLGDLDGGEPDGARAPMDQDCLAATEAGEMDQ